MKQFIILLFILTCKLAVSINVIIDHGDSHKTYFYVRDYDGTMEVNTFQEHEGGLYFTENRETGVKVSYLLPIETTKENSILSQSKETSADGKRITFSYSTANQETRNEEFAVDDSDKVKVKGSFSYVDPNGYKYLQGYEADENGYRTKVSFGTKIMYLDSKLESVLRTITQTKVSPADKKQEDENDILRCSLAGGGIYCPKV